MKKTLLIASFVIATGMAQAASAQIAASAQQDRQSPRELFENYNEIRVAEKVFVHTDRDSYMSGDTLWLRAYRVHAGTHSPMLYSGLVYVDIFNADNKHIAKIQLPRNGQCFRGTYKLPKEMVPGYYTLTAYTYWMQNFPSEFYFSKRIYIHNPKDLAIRSEIEFLPDYSKQTIATTVKFTKTNGEPFKRSLFFVQQLKDGQQVNTSIERANAEGIFTMSLPMRDNLTDLNVSVKDNDPIQYSRNFKVPIFSDSIDVQFMPEGGHLLDGVTQHVAFKAIGADGKPVEVSGSVTDSKGDTIAKIASVHKGMGEFLIQPKLGEKYTAKLSTADGRGTSVELPSVAAEGIGLMVSSKPDTLTYSVFSTEGFDYTGMNLAVQCRGKILMWQPIAGPGKNRLSPRMMPEGLLHFFIVDDNGKVYSERLALVNRDENSKVAINGLKTSYVQRERVEAEIDISDLNDRNTAELSVSVTDVQRAFQIPSDNIVSYLLLSSDIKGTIEEPWYYFDTSIDAATRAYHAQLLLMTQGWKRFDLASVFRGEIPSMKYKIESTQSISGRVTKIISEKRVPDNSFLILTAPNNSAGSWIAKPDSSGYFTVNNMNFPNKTIFHIQGVEKKTTITKKEKTKTKYKNNSIDIQIFRKMFEPYTPVQHDREIYRPGAGMKTGTTEYEIARDFHTPKTAKYIYDANGERILLLSPAEIIAQQVYRSTNDSTLLSTTTAEEILESGLYLNLREWLMAQPEIKIMHSSNVDSKPLYYKQLKDGKQDMSTFGENDTERILFNGLRARLSVDGLKTSLAANGFRHTEPETYQKLNIPISQIESVSISVDHSKGIEGEPANFYRILVNASGFSEQNTRNNTARFTFNALGNNEPLDFYKPVYGRANDDPAPDARVTVYWEPNVKVDSYGKAKIAFYMNDMPSNYMMTVNGITAEGKPFYKQATINLYNK